MEGESPGFAEDERGVRANPEGFGLSVRKQEATLDGGGGGGAGDTVRAGWESGQTDVPCSFGQHLIQEPIRCLGGNGAELGEV